MTVEEWGILIGALTTALAAVGPWMFMVHAKLAVLSAQMARLDQKVDRLFEAHQERLPTCIRHETTLEEVSRRLEGHDLQLADVQERLRETA